jgi:hypothetical protein
MLHSLVYKFLFVFLLLVSPSSSPKEKPATHTERTKPLQNFAMNPQEIKTTHKSFNDKYKVKDGEVPFHTTKRVSDVPGVEIWSITLDPASDPVHVVTWLVFGTVRHRMGVGEMGSFLKEINYLPKSKDEALAVASLPFQNENDKIIDEKTAVQLDIPDDIKKKLSPPRVDEKDGHYTVAISVFSGDQGAKRFLNMDTRTILSYRFEIGSPTYFDVLSTETVWEAEQSEKKRSHE